MRTRGQAAAGAAWLRASGESFATFVFGAAPPARIPAAARAAIARNREDGEILVGWLQVAAIVTFALLYAVSEKTFSSSTTLEPVPLALGLYSVFTTVRLILANRRRLTRSFLAASVVVDIAVLMVTIWSFHLQYQTPPGLYLKAPTLLYVFILIAIRALSLDWRQIALAGASAIAGWFLLVVYAAEHGATITHSYTTYMMSYALLLGAEIDKLISIGMVTTVLAIAVVRAERLMARMIVGENATRELSRFVGADVAERIKSADRAIAAGDGELREAATLFIDLRGFTRASAALEPRGVIALLHEYQELIVPLVTHAGGTIDKFLGDGILVSFGAARPSARFAAEALGALENILTVGSAWVEGRKRRGLPAPEVAVALTTGPVVFGAVGHGDRLEFTVIGDSVNLAAKLEKHAKTLGSRAVASREAYERALGQGAVPLRGARVRLNEMVEGVGAPVDLMIIA